MVQIARAFIVCIDDRLLSARRKSAVCLQQFTAVVIAIGVVEIGIEHDCDLASEF